MLPSYLPVRPKNTLSIATTTSVVVLVGGSTTRLLPYAIALGLVGSQTPTISLDLDDNNIPSHMMMYTTHMAGVPCSGIMGGEKLASHPLCRETTGPGHTEKISMKCAAGGTAEQCPLPTAHAFDHHDGR
jgi:hypothetical protein